MIKLLDGLRVIECAVLPTGDHTGRLLGDLGADVIKIERPGEGDYLRELGGALAPHHSAFHLYCNRNKRSVTLDLRSDEGRAIFFELLQTADIFVDGFADDACVKMGVGYEDQRKVKPDIIYCQANGFGVKGPYGPIPVHGYMMGAVAGAVTLEEQDDGLVHEVPPPEGLYFAGQLDGPLMGATFAVLTALGALHHRQRTGEGVYIDAAGADAVVFCQSTDALLSWNAARITMPENNAPPTSTHPRKRPKYTFYKTKDGKYVMLAAIEHKFWDNFCRAIGRDDLQGIKDTAVPVDFQVFEGGRTDLIDELKEVFLTRTLAEWVELAVAYDIPLSPANQREDLVDDPHLRARNLIHESVHPQAGPFTSPGWPAVISEQSFDIAQPAPTLGEHTEEVLRELGYKPADLDDLRHRGVV
jgi:formyl-CoA transferase